MESFRLIICELDMVVGDVVGMPLLRRLIRVANGEGRWWYRNRSILLHDEASH